MDEDIHKATDVEKTWIAFYTRPRFEVGIASQLKKIGIESYVPLRRECHQWSDRKKWVNVPLIPSYVFVYLDIRNYFRVFAINGVIRVVMFNGRIARIRDNDIELLRKVENYGEPVEVVSQDYNRNEEVEIINGIFKGYSGHVISVGSKYKICIRIEEIEYSPVIEIPIVDIRHRSRSVVVS